MKIFPMRVAATLIVALFLYGCASRGGGQVWRAEAVEHFTYNGKPISPLLIEEFCCWLSDKAPQVQAVDLKASEGSNRYFGEMTVRPGGWVKMITDEKGLVQQGFTEYRVTSHDQERVGLRVEVCGGGSGIFHYDLIVHFEEWPPLLGRSEARHMIILDASN